MKMQLNLASALSGRGVIEVRIATDDQVEWFDGLLADHHSLGAGRPVGDYLRQVVLLDQQPVALLVWGPACYAVKRAVIRRSRDDSLGKTRATRVRRLSSMLTRSSALEVRRRF